MLDHEALFKVMPIPRFIVQVSGDSHYTIYEVNDRALEYFGQSEKQVVGQTLENLVGSESSRHFMQSFEVCIAQKKPVSIQALPMVPGRIRINWFWVNPVADDKGDVVFLDIIGQADVTDQSIMQRERDDAISLLTSVFEVSETGIVVTDHENRIVRVNDSFVRIYGWSRDELINANITGLVTPDEREVVKKNYDEFIKTGSRNSGEMKIIRKDGSIANALFTVATLELSQKRRFQVTTVMDITLRKQMEQSLLLAKEQADAANMAKSTFLANMSHELRTPLNAIIGFSEMMLKETFGSVGHGKYSEYLEDIHTSAGHLLEIINEVLDMSKIEAGRIELDESEIDMKETLYAVSRMMDSRAFDRELKILIEVNEDLPNLYSDQRLVRQILINLVTNALKFSEKGNKIEIKGYTLDDGRMQILIADEGVGIPRNKIEQAMEPFGQVNDGAETRKYNAQGTGLGLPIAKAMAELHDATLFIDSDAGMGTKVYVNFPAYRVIARQDMSKTASQQEKPGLAQGAE